MATQKNITALRVNVYRLCDDGGQMDIEAASLSEATEIAENEMADGDWCTPDEHKTTWVHARLRGWDEAGNEVNEPLTVAIDPEEPDCTDPTGHDWQAPIEIVGGCRENPGVHGHGGGVIITEVCVHCGCAKYLDTWAQDPSTGEQGLKSVEYEPGKYAAEVAGMTEEG